MNLPTSETKPDGFSTLPPDQKRRIRLVIKNADQTEISEYLRELKRISTPSINYFLVLLVSAILMGIGLSTWSPLILLLAALTAPFLSPLLGLGLSPSIPSFRHAAKSVLSLIITAVVYFGAGWLSAQISNPILSSFYRPFSLLLGSGILEWLCLILAAGLTTYWFSCQNEFYRLSSAFLLYLAFLPIALAGWQFQVSSGSIFPPALTIALLRLVIALLIITLVFWLIRLPPRRVAGWALMLTFLLGAVFLSFTTFSEKIAPVQASANLKNQVPISVIDHPMLMPASTPTPLLPTPTKSPSTPIPPTATLQPTATSTPSPVSAWVNTPYGVTIRQSPDSKSAPVSYALDRAKLQLLGEQVLTDSTIWEKVLSPDGKIGWVVGRYLITATP